MGGEAEREERGSETGALDITLRGLNLSKNVSLSDGLRSLFLRMVQGGQISICPGWPSAGWGWE